MKSIVKKAREIVTQLYERNMVAWNDLDREVVFAIQALIAEVQRMEALAQPEQAPVATVTSEAGNPDVRMSWWHEPPLPVGTKLYTTPPQRTWVGLTMDEATALWESTDDQDSWELLKRVEAKLKDKNL